MIFHIISSSTSQQQNKIPQNLIKPTRAHNNLGKKQLLGNNMDDKNADNKKKTIHREIERQRRQEMASLHADLRSIIPLEYIKGKRSMSDHMNCAVNYINQLKITISELTAKRDNLINNKSDSRDKAVSSESGIIVSSYDFNVISCLAINECSVGVEILLSSINISSFKGNSLPLSKVLRVLIEKGLDLVSCVTAKVSDEGFLHTIQAEVSGERCIDFAHLQQIINETISSRK